MAMFGLDWFESKEDRKIRIDAYNRLIYPFGDKQKENINYLLKELFKNETIQESTYNFIVSKQALMKTSLSSLDNKEVVNLISNLKDSFITRNSDVITYLVLADIDLNIDNDLNYPSIEEIKNKVVSFKDSL